MRTVTIKRESFESPCVYEFMRAGKALYIGLGRAGLFRVFGPRIKDTNNKPRTDAIASCDSVQIHLCDSLPDAVALEAKLIHEKHPPYNRYCYTCKDYRIVDGRVLTYAEELVMLEKLK
jgi:excinuclease UvrABC nuclease subunit